MNGESDTMCENNLTKTDKLKWVFILRQTLISSGACTVFFLLGLTMGAPTVLVPQLRKEANSSDAVTPEEASWLPVIFSYCGIPWVFLLPMMAAFFGRKITHTFNCCCSLIGLIIFYCSSNIHHIMISEICQGTIMASYGIVSLVITEYTSSEYRGLFLTIKAVSVFWGILVANVIGTFMHWKMIPMFGIACILYCLLTVYFWPESPLWLAKKGRLDQCAKSQRWLKGSSEKSEKELEKLMSNHQNATNKFDLKRQTIEIIHAMTKKEFCKPLSLCVLLLALYTFSGKLVIAVYAIDILKKVTNNTSTAYTGMLILDAVTVITMYVGCVITKILKRRILLLSTSIISILFLFSLSLYLYLVKLSLISDNKFVSLSLLIGFSIAVACGPMIMSTSMAGELIPLESREFSLCAIGLSFKVLIGLVFKVSPYCFSYFGMHGTFFAFGMSSTILLVFIYLYIPETKDKTLQEISDQINGTKPVEDVKELIPILRNVTIAPKVDRSLLQ